MQQPHCPEGPHTRLQGRRPAPPQLTYRRPTTGQPPAAAPQAGSAPLHFRERLSTGAHTSQARGDTIGPACTNEGSPRPARRHPAKHTQRSGIPPGVIMKTGSRLLRKTCALQCDFARSPNKAGNVSLSTEGSVCPRGQTLHQRVCVLEAGPANSARVT